MNKHLGYIASPYTIGDVDLNVKAHCKIFSLLRATGKLIPIAPLWADIHYKHHGEKYRYYVEYDNDLIKVLPLRWILRANAHTWNFRTQTSYHEERSAGADREIEFAQEHHPDIIVITQLPAESYDSVIGKLLRALDEKYPT